MCEKCQWLPVALKRKWVPEWLWLILAKSGIVLIYPFRWILTFKPTARDIEKLYHHDEPEKIS